MRKVAVGLSISYENRGQLDRCLRMVRRAFGDALECVLFIDNGSRHGAWLTDLPLTRGVLSIPDEPIFIRMQRFVTAFLDETEAYALVKIDPDTVVLRWDREFPDLAGEMLHYHPRHQSARWSIMPEWWRRNNGDFIRTQYMHGIHGGYAWYSRAICERIRDMFCGYDCSWNPDTVRTGRLKESDDMACMIGEEHMFAWFLKQKGIKVGDSRQMDMSRRKYYTYRGNVSDIPEPEELNVFHPVKTNEVFLELMEKVGWQGFDWRGIEHGP